MKINTKIILAVLAIVLVILVLLINMYTAKKARDAALTGTTPTPTLGIYPTLSVTEQVKTQQASDVHTGQLKADTEKQYPWLDQLPLQTIEYFVYFDEDKRKFIGKLYVKNRSTEIIKNEVVAELQGIPVPLDKYPIEWEVK